MNWTIVSVILAFCFGAFGVVTYMISNIDKQIEAKMNDPAFINKVASQIRLPFILFDENERFIVNSGAEKYINSIKVNRQTITEGFSVPKEFIVSISIECDKFLTIQPVLQCITSRMIFYDAKRIGQKGWIFDRYLGGFSLTDYPISKGDPPPELFKLDIIPSDVIPTK